MSSPRLWLKFSSRKSDGITFKFRIQDLPRDRWEEIIDFYLIHFAPDEAVHKAAGVCKSYAAIAEYRKLWRERFEKESSYHVFVCCLDKNSETEIGEIIAVSVTEAITGSEDVSTIKFKTKEMQKFFEIVHHQETAYDFMAIHSLDSFHDDRGLAVHRDYRGMGIAKEILKVRRMSCKERGELMTGAWMTSIGTQKAAERDGWQTLSEISYGDLGRQSGVTFEEPIDRCKFMAWRP